MNLLAMIMVLTPSAPPVYRAMVCFQKLPFTTWSHIIQFTIPNNALQNAMACRVFRGLRLNIIPTVSEPGTGPGTSLPLHWRPTNSGVHSINGVGSSDFQRMEGKTVPHLDPYANNFVGIKVTRDVEMVRDEDLEPSRYDMKQ